MVLSSVPIDRSSSAVVAEPTSFDSFNVVEWSPLSLPATPLFGTDGIRGRVGELLTPNLALQIGFWAGRVWQQTRSGAPVILGQDSRNSSDLLAAAIAAGFRAAGLEVWNLGLCPTPTVAYLTQALGAIGGVMISASHNPPDDNGIKFFSATGTKLSSAVQAQIEATLRQGNSEDWQVAVIGNLQHRPELIEAYVESLYASLPQTDLTGMRVVLDLAWGAAANLGERVFRQMGAEVICLHDRPDGDRINVHCGSTHLASLQAAVQEHTAELGFAFDGDADRVMAVDAHGRVVDGDYILYFWGQTLRQSDRLPGNVIVSTVMANLGFERAWQNQGGTLIRTAVGDQYVHAEMVQRGAMLGGEQSGHILCPHYSVSGDGMLTALHLAAIVRQSGCSLAELVDQSFQTYPQLLRNVRVEDRDRRLNWKHSEPLQRAIAQAETDMGDRGRVLVRASGTEPVIRVMVEAESTDLVRHWTEKLAEAVQQYAAV